MCVCVNVHACCALWGCRILSPHTVSIKCRGWGYGFLCCFVKDHKQAGSGFIFRLQNLTHVSDHPWLSTSYAVCAVTFTFHHITSFSLSLSLSFHLCFSHDLCLFLSFYNCVSSPLPLPSSAFTLSLSLSLSQKGSLKALSFWSIKSAWGLSALFWGTLNFADKEAKCNGL